MDDSMKDRDKRQSHHLSTFKKRGSSIICFSLWQNSLIKMVALRHYGPKKEKLRKEST